MELSYAVLCYVRVHSTRTWYVNTLLAQICMYEIYFTIYVFGSCFPPLFCDLQKAQLDQGSGENDTLLKYLFGTIP